MTKTCGIGFATLFPSLAFAQSAPAISPMDIFSIVSNVASLILSVIAIWLSLYFYTKAKDTEAGVQSALAEIKQQTESLQKLAGRQLDRLTKFAVEPRQSVMDEHFPQILTILQQLPQTITATFTRLEPQQDNEGLLSELVNCYIGIYFYSALTNYWSQFYLPPAATFDENNEFHQLVSRVIDLSYHDAIYMADLIAKCDASRIRNSSLNHLLEATVTHWVPHLRTSAQVFVAAAHNQPPA